MRSWNDAVTMYQPLGLNWALVTAPLCPLRTTFSVPPETLQILHGSIARGSQQRLTVRAECHGRQLVTVPLQRCDRASVIDRPDPRRAVERSRGNQLAVWTEIRRGDLALMPDRTFNSVPSVFIRWAALSLVAARMRSPPRLKTTCGNFAAGLDRGHFGAGRRVP